jgi:hypothetical protein
MIARIRNEKDVREDLEKQRKELLATKLQLINENKKRKDDLANLDEQLKRFSECPSRRDGRRRRRRADKVQSSRQGRYRLPSRRTTRCCPRTVGWRWNWRGGNCRHIPHNVTIIARQGSNHTQHPATCIYHLIWMGPYVQDTPRTPQASGGVSTYLGLCISPWCHALHVAPHVNCALLYALDCGHLDRT